MTTSAAAKLCKLAGDQGGRPCFEGYEWQMGNRHAAIADEAAAAGDGETAAAHYALAAGWNLLAANLHEGSEGEERRAAAYCLEQAAAAAGPVLKKLERRR